MVYDVGARHAVPVDAFVGAGSVCHAQCPWPKKPAQFTREDPLNPHSIISQNEFANSIMSVISYTIKTLLHFTASIRT
jgi:hypothetical protein